MKSLRALRAMTADLDALTRVSLLACAALAAAALGVTASGAGASASPEAAAGPAGQTIPLAGLALSRELTAERATAAPARPAAQRNKPGIARLPAPAIALIVALPVGILAGFAAARRLAPPAERHRPAAGAAATGQTGPRAEVERLKRSLKRRDRRIKVLKRKLKGAGPKMPPTAPPEGATAELEKQLADANAAILRLEELLRDHQAEWARSETVSARDTDRVAALEADLRAAGDIIEALHEDIGYWKRRATGVKDRAETIGRMTGSV